MEVETVDPRSFLASQPIQNGELLAQRETLSPGIKAENDRHLMLSSGIFVYGCVHLHTHTEEGKSRSRRKRERKK